MSGEVPAIELIDGPDGGLARLVRVLAEVVQLADMPIALVGGLAVIARVGVRHRATIDVDAVYLGDGAEVDLDRVLVVAGATPAANGVDLDGVEIDTIPVVDVVEDDLPDDLQSRCFALAHKWALDTATPQRIVVSAPSEGVETSVEIPTATGAALIATKLSSFPSRPERDRQRKQVSDIHDLYRLLVMADVAALRMAYANSPVDLAATANALAREMLGARVVDVRRALTLGADSMGGVTVDEFASALETLFVAVAELI